jgi:hypothetical protein
MRRSFTHAELATMYREVKAEEARKREHSNSIRELAWYYATASKPYAWRWWRLGFQTVYGRRVDRHDYTVIPRHDTLAQEVAETFPEFEGVDGCEALWELLMSPYNPMPRKETMLAETERRLIELKRREKMEVKAGFAFGANVAVMEFV